MFQRFRCCECYRVQKSSLSQQVLSKIVVSLQYIIQVNKPDVGFISIAEKKIGIGTFMKNKLSRSENFHKSAHSGNSHQNTEP